MGNPQISTLEVSGELKNATAVINWVDSELERGGVSGETASEILICVDEAFSNIIFHSNKHQSGGPSWTGGSAGMIRIRLSVNAHSVTVVFCDDAEALILPGVKPQLGQAMLERATPGVGVYIMRQLMDEVSYQRDGNTNCLTLIKKLKS